MDIRVLEFAEGAKNAKGLTVIIDVFRAFSVACYAYDAGAERVIAASSIENALFLKRKIKKSILAGERNEKKIDGFELGNSPTEIIKRDFTGMTFIFTTTAGTNGMVNASSASQIISGSLVNAQAVTEYIAEINPEIVSLVAMGYRGTVSADEDLLCAKIITDRLNGEKLSYDKEISALKEGAGKRFFEPANLDFSPPTDFFLCTMIDRFNFVLRAEKMYDGSMELFRNDF